MFEGLTPLESVMWRVGHEPSMRMVVSQLLILDRRIERAGLVERMRALAEEVPHLKELPNEANPLRWRPHWITDRDHDANRHVRELTLSTAGGLREILDTVALLEPLPFDPDRPPWDVTLLQGAEDRKSAVLLRAHHALVDGFAGASIVERLLGSTTGRDEPPPPPAGDNDGENGRKAATITIDLTRAVRPLSSALRASVRSDALETVVEGLQSRLDVANSVSRQMVATGGRLGGWPATQSMDSRFEVLTIPDARKTALQLGGSRNDLLVAAAAGGLGDYLRQLGQPASELRAALPTIILHGPAHATNWFAPLRVEVPTATSSPGPQFGVVSERLARARSEPAVRVMATLASAVSRLPTRVLIRALRGQADTVDFSATTLPGKRVPGHLCGAVVERTYAFGPRLGCPVNLTAIGNGDGLDIGIVIDPLAVEKAETLLDCLHNAFTRFAPIEVPTSG
jgi:WS/DGAT/MGAT family acyltransferase